jgi:hypothetical protein
MSDILCENIYREAMNCFDRLVRLRVESGMVEIVLRKLR